MRTEPLMVEGLRRAVSSDSAGIAAIWNPVIREGVETFNSAEKTIGDIHELIERVNANGYAFVVAADASGGVDGFAFYGQFRGGVGYRHTFEHTLYVAPSAFGRGIGRNLLRAVEAHAKSVGGHSMIAGISGENLSGVSFHSRCGYRDIARLPQVGYKFGRWHDLVLMQKLL